MAETTQHNHSALDASQSSPLRAVLIVIVVGTLAIAAHSTYIAFRDMYVFPYWDMGTVQYQYFNLPFRQFFLYRGNEHLPFLAMPLVAIDNLMFSARGTSLIAEIIVFNALLAAVLIAHVRRCFNGETLEIWAAAGLVIATLFWLIHYENLVWPAQIHVYLSVFFVLSAGHYASLRDRQFREDSRHGIVAAAPIGLLLVAATFTFGYGAIGWLAILALAVLRRWSWRVFVPLTVLFAFTGLVYARYYNYAITAQHSNPLTSLGEPIATAKYVLYFLASPIVGLLTAAFERRVAIAIGMAVTIGACALASLVLFRTLVTRREQAGSTDLFVAFLILFSTGTGIITGLSRLRFGAEQAFESRYAVVQVLFWIALGLAGAMVTRRRHGLRRGLLAFGGVVVLVLMIRTQATYAATVSAGLQTHWQAVLALMNRVEDRAALAAIHPGGAEFILNISRNLRVRNWSVYAEPAPNWLNQSATRLFRRLPAERCLGAFDSVSDLGRLGGNSYLDGWAWDLEGGRPPRWVVLVDADDIVRGVGRAGWERLDVGQVHPVMAGSAPGWRAYVALPAPAASVEAYAVVADQDSICPLHRDAAK